MEDHGHHPDRLARIALRLAELRELDPPQPGKSHFIDKDGRRLDGHVVFGADLHHHRNQPVPEQQLAELEATMGCALPEDFRAFLSTIGVGAGPHYGVDWKLLENSARAGCARPFPDAERGPIYLDEAGDDEVEGCLGMSSLGCGDFTGIVTSGPARGRVVSMIYNRDEWILGPGFLDYYEDWLDRTIGKLRTEPDRKMIV